MAYCLAASISTDNALYPADAVLSNMIGSSASVTQALPVHRTRPSCCYVHTRETAAVSLTLPVRFFFFAFFLGFLLSSSWASSCLS
ncbi:hypothetical protein M0804_015121 [Polistes exclamans]|nr:hypothetical protein M0804_015121 [Polistes exclamans]